MRAPVTWNGCGLPSSRSTIASPSTTRSPPGRAATASTTSGTRSVISSRLRVNTETSPDRRCTCTRMPSSLPSTRSSPPPTDATASSAVFADAASIGRTGRPTTSPTSSSAAAPPRAASDATSAAVPASMAARRTTESGTAYAAATAPRTTPSRAPWRRLPVMRSRRNRCSSAVARPRRPASSALREAADPAPARRREPAEGGVDLGHGERRLGRGARAACRASGSRPRGVAAGAPRTGARRRRRPRRGRTARTARPVPRSWPCASASRRRRWRPRRPRRG